MATIGNILMATVRVKGYRPLFWHAFGPWAIPLEKQERTGVAGHDPEEWRKSVLYTKEGQLYLLPAYFFGSFRGGAKYTKRGRSTLMTSVQATLQVFGNDADRILIEDRFIPGFNTSLPEDVTRDSSEPVYLDVRSTKNPKTRARNVRYRVAAAPGWEAGFSIQWDKTVLSRGEMESIAIDAGKLVGVGDGRVIGMGRYTIEEFTVEENEG